jgi:hypothetical protein
MASAVVCLDCPGKVSFYSSASVLRGRVVVDHGAAFPAGGRARRGCGSALRVQAKRMVATAGSGDVGIARIVSMSSGGVHGIFFPVYGGGGPGSGRGHVWRRRGGVGMLNG